MARTFNTTRQNGNQDSWASPSRYGNERTSRYGTKDTSRYRTENTSRYGTENTNRYGTENTSRYGERSTVGGNREGHDSAGYGNRDGYNNRSDSKGNDGDDAPMLIRPVGRFPRLHGGTGPGPRVKSKLGRLPRDNEITQPYVHVRSDESGVPLGEPRLTQDVLKSLDLKTHSLVLVLYPDQLSEEDRASAGAPKWPICKIVEKKAEREKERLAKSSKKNVQTKEMELNWATAPNDLDHKLKQMKKFLSKGWKVQLMLLNKPGKKKHASKKEATEMVEKVKAAVEEVKGAKEWKKSEGALQASMKLFLQGPDGGAKEGEAQPVTGVVTDVAVNALASIATIAAPQST